MSNISGHADCPPSYLHASYKGYHKSYLNGGVGTNYIFICVKKVGALDLKGSDMIVNALYINIENRDCGSFKRDETDLNDTTGGPKLYLCYGEDTTSGLAPISDIRINDGPQAKILTKEDNDQTSWFDCLATSGNYGTSGREQKICYIRNPNAPKKLTVTNLQLHTERQKTLEATKEITIDEFIVNNGVNTKHSLKKGNTKNTAKETSTTNEGTLTIGIQNKHTFGTPLFSLFTVTLDIKLELSFNWSQTTIESSSDSTSTELTCIADEKESIKCSSFKSQTKLEIPYSYEKVYESYNHHVSRYTINGVMTNVSQSDIRVSQCCMKCNAEHKKTPCNSSPAKTSKIQEEEEEPYTLTNTVVTQIKVISSRERNYSCPPNMTKLNDINAGAGGKAHYIHLCVEKKTLDKIAIEDQLINDYQVLKDNSNCGNLNSVGDVFSADLNAGTDSNTHIYLCVGFNEKTKLAPISDVFLQLDNIPRNIPPDTECSSLDLNSGVKNAKRTYFCVRRDLTAPKKLIISDMMYGEIEKKDLTVPTEISRLEVQGGILTKTISGSKKTTNISGFSFQVGLSVGLSFSSGNKVLGTENEFTVSVSGSYKRTKTETDSEENGDSVTVTCEAPKNKKVRCMYYQTKQEVIATYTANVIPVYYDDREGEIYEKKGTLKKNQASSISVTICCLENCEEGEVECPKSTASREEETS